MPENNENTVIEEPVEVINNATPTLETMINDMQLTAKKHNRKHWGSPLSIPDTVKKKRKKKKKDPPPPPQPSPKRGVRRRAKEAYVITYHHLSPL